MEEEEVVREAGEERIKRVDGPALGGGVEEMTDPLETRSTGEEVEESGRDEVEGTDGEVDGRREEVEGGAADAKFESSPSILREMLYQRKRRRKKYIG